jgi:hypothetical protein
MTLRDEVYSRAKGHCECTAEGCGHAGQRSQRTPGSWLPFTPQQAQTPSSSGSFRTACIPASVHR